MLTSGLVSVTFRKLSPKEIVALVAQGGLTAIEWGGDIHVPHGNTQAARDVKALTLDAGLRVAAYGSYYRVGQEKDANAFSFNAVVETAAALGAPIIRVWAGNRGSAQADEAYWSLIEEESRRIAGLAAQANIRVAYEFHGGTLTDSNATALRLVKEVHHPNMGAYWQPLGNLPATDLMDGLKSLTPWLANIHCYYWKEGARCALAEGREAWAPFLQHIRQAGKNPAILIEFVKDEEPAAFLQDAAALRSWLA